MFHPSLTLKECCSVLCSGWFGIRQSYGEFVLTKSAILQELVNVSYVKDDLLPPSTEAKTVATNKEAKKKQAKTHLVGTLESLYIPD